MYLKTFFADICAIPGICKILYKKPFIFHFAETTFQEIKYNTIFKFIVAVNMNDKRNTLLFLDQM